MEIIDNINRLLGDNLKQSIVPGAKYDVVDSYETLMKLVN